MPRVCSICTHPDREAIDRFLVSGSSNLSLSSLFDVSEAAVRRHKANHLPASLVKAHEAEEVSRADGLLEDVRSLQDRALAILDRAEGSGDLRTALSAIREARANLELLAKLLGELRDAPAVNVHLSPEWIELRSLVVVALEPFPEAREAVAMALEGAGNGR